jgi:hypothetical protein
MGKIWERIPKNVPERDLSGRGELKVNGITRKGDTLYEQTLIIQEM